MKSRMGRIIFRILDAFVILLLSYGIYKNYLEQNFEACAYAVISLMAIIFLLIMFMIVEFYQTSIIPTLMEIIEPSKLPSAGMMITIKFSNKFGSRIFIFDNKCTPSGGCLIANLIGNF